MRYEGHIVLADKRWEWLCRVWGSISGVQLTAGGGGAGENHLISQKRGSLADCPVDIGITIIDQKQNKDVVGPAVAHCHHLLSLLLSLLISDAVWSSVV